MHRLLLDAHTYVDDKQVIEWSHRLMRNDGQDGQDGQNGQLQPSCRCQMVAMGKRWEV
jgi:hypothetical protein